MAARLRSLLAVSRRERLGTCWHRWARPSLLAAVLLKTPAAVQAQATPMAAEPEPAPEPKPTTYGARASSRTERGAGSTVLNAEQAKRSAGALGEPARAITNLAGVGRAGFDSGELIIWGSTDNETRTYIDGVELPMLFHPGGFRSTLHPALLETVVLTKGAPGAEFGRAVGGTVELETKPLRDDSSHVGLAVDTLDVSGTLQGAAGPVRGVYGARLGYIDRLASWVAPRSGDIVPVPEYADGYAKLQLAASETETWSLAWLASHDVWTRGMVAVDPASSRTETQNRDLQLGYLRYQRVLSDRARVEVTPYLASHQRARRSQSGTVPWQLDNDEVRYGLRASYVLQAPLFDLRIGLDAQAIGSQLSRVGTLTLPAREGDITVFGQPPGNEITRDRWTTFDVNVAPHASLRARWAGFTVTPGVRLETHALTVSRLMPVVPGTPVIGGAQLAVRPEPRIQVRYDGPDWLALQARAGISHQAPLPEDRSAVFGNPKLGISRAFTIAGGPQLRPLRELTIDITGFYKSLSGLATRNPAVPQPPANVLLPEGTGKSFGGELSLTLREWNGLAGQLSYTLSRSRRQDLSGAERFFDFDQTHMLAFVWGYRYGNFRVSGRARVSTGNPRTAVIDHYQNLRDDRAEPIFGAHNELRLPTFFALDLRVEQSFTVAALSGAIWLDVLNVTDHRNVEDIAYRFDYEAREDVVGLPVLAVLGVSAQL